MHALTIKRQLCCAASLHTQADAKVQNTLRSDAPFWRLSGLSESVDPDPVIFPAELPVNFRSTATIASRSAERIQHR